jgi:hypothetical protein
MARRAYSTDLTDAQWALIEPFLRVWKAKRVSPSGYEGGYDLVRAENSSNLLSWAFCLSHPRRASCR